MAITIFRDLTLAIAIEFVRLLLTPFVPLVVLFRRPIGVTTRHRVEGGESVEDLIVPRSELPRWLWWWQTTDEPLPGGMYEPTVRNWYINYGDYICSVLWLLRNRLYGLSWAFGRPAERYLDPIPGKIARDGDLWRGWWRFGPVVVQAGWKVHRKDFDANAQNGPFWAIPFVTIRLVRNS